MSIEEQIDNAIRDCAVGPDAMRWTPDPPTSDDPQGGRLIPVTLNVDGSADLVDLDPSDDGLADAPSIGWGATDCGWAWTSEAGIGGSQWRAATEPAIQITLDNSQGRFEPGGPIAFATDAPVPRWTLAPDEVELVDAIIRDGAAAALMARANTARPRWWRRLARWTRRSTR